MQATCGMRCHTGAQVCAKSARECVCVDVCSQAWRMKEKGLNGEEKGLQGPRGEGNRQTGRNSDKRVG